MRYVWLVLLLVLAVMVLSVTAVLWITWTLHLHMKDKKLTLALQVAGIRRTVFQRDFSANSSEKKEQNAVVNTGVKNEAEERVEEKEKEKEEAKSENSKKGKKRFAARWEADKKRIYDPENGGWQPGGFSEVLAEYRETWEQIWETFSGFFGDLRYRIQVPMLRIGLDFGTGNPAHTGMLYGTIWSAVGGCYPLLSRYLRMAYPMIELTPDFYEKRFNLEIKSIIKVKPAHIMNALLKQGWRLAVTYCKEYFNKGSVKHG